MKNTLITLIGAMVLAVMPSAFAQAVPKSVTQTLTVPTTVAAATLTNLATAPVLDGSLQQTVPVTFTVKGSGASTTNIEFKFATSISGNYYDTNVNTKTIAVALNGTTATTVVTNLNVPGAQYYKLLSIYNRDSSVTLTNVEIAYQVKISCP